MPKSAKLLLGLFVLWATVYATAALYGDFALTTTTIPGLDVHPLSDRYLVYLNAAVALGVLLIEVWLVLGLGSMRLADRVLWAFGLLFFFPLAAPAFWYLHIWRTPRLPRRPRQP
jgi:hypothetical protein